MRWSIVVLAAAVACQAQPAAAPSSTSDPSATNETLFVAVADEQCVRRTFDKLIAAVNAADDGRIAALFGGSFQWLTVRGATTYDVRAAVERLVSVGHSGERWSLKQLDVNGRGWHGGVDYGVVIRRSGAGVPEPYRDAAGKGVIDCPAERVILFGLGD